MNKHYKSWALPCVGLLVAIFVTSCDGPADRTSQVDEVPVAEGAVVGRANMSRMLKRAVYDEFDFNISDYIADDETFYPALGQYNSFGYYDGGKPNAYNMFLWDLMFKEVANDLASVCSGREESHYPRIDHDSFLGIRRLCHSHDKAVLLNIWDRLLFFDSQDEFVAWEDALHRHGITSIEDHEKRVRETFYAMLMNPHVLLR